MINQLHDFINQFLIFYVLLINFDDFSKFIWIIFINQLYNLINQFFLFLIFY